MGLSSCYKSNVFMRINSENHVKPCSLKHNRIHITILLQIAGVLFSMLTAAEVILERGLGLVVN